MFDKAFKVVQKGIKSIVENISGSSGSKIAINGRTYIEERLIAEGGFGYIYLVTEPSTSLQYALKRINISDKDQLTTIKHEIDIWKKLSASKYIIKLIDSEITPTAAFILMEYAPEGTLFDFITKKTNKELNEKEALIILYHIASGLSSMHSQSPPITHRDIKIENVLRCGSVFKLCDFGSASTFVLDPSKEDKKVVQQQFSQFEKNSTFNYRPPEMCDVYSNYIVNEKVDVWAMGCVFYAMLFKKHPFQDAQKLTIISGQYYLPEDYDQYQYSEKLLDFMRLFLTPNPSVRPSVGRVIEMIKKWKSIEKIDLSQEVLEVKKMQLKAVNRTSVENFFYNGGNNEGSMEMNSISNKDKSQDLWDFDFGNNNQPSNIVVENKQEKGSEVNLYDFEFCDDGQKNTNNIVSNKNNEDFFGWGNSHQIQPQVPTSTHNNSQNLFDFPGTFTMSQQSMNSTNNNNQQSMNNGLNFDIFSNNQSTNNNNNIPSSSNIPSNKQQQPQPKVNPNIYQVNNNKLNNPKNPEPITSNQGDQDILNFF